MSAREPRFEVVRTDAPQPWHARFRAANGRVVWTTENYQRRGGALGAIESLTDSCARFGDARWGAFRIEVRELDERGHLAPIPDLDDAQALGRWAATHPKVKAEIQADRKINAIKELRDATGAGLMQSKEAIETLPGMKSRWVG